MTDETDERKTYRENLVKGRDDAQSSFDRAIMSLSGGALAVALGLIRTKTPPDWPIALMFSWSFFAASLLCTLFSFRASYHSFNKALEQLGSTMDLDRIYRELPGGSHAVATERLNDGALYLFVLGLILLAVFVGLNIERLG